MLLRLLLDADTERLRQLGVGGGIVVIVLGMVFAFILKWREVKSPPESAVSVDATNGKAGERATTFWLKAIQDIIEAMDERQTAAIVDEIREARQESLRKQIEILDCLRRIEIAVERRRTVR